MVSVSQHSPGFLQRGPTGYRKASSVLKAFSVIVMCKTTLSVGANHRTTLKQTTDVELTYKYLSEIIRKKSHFFANCKVSISLVQN